MKKWIGALPLVLVLLQLVYPVCIAVALATDLIFRSYHVVLYVTILAILMSVSTVLLCGYRIDPSRSCNGCFLVLLPLSIINGMIWFSTMKWFLTAMAGVNVICAVILLCCCASRGKMVSGIVSGVMALICAFMCLLGLIVSVMMPADTVISEHDSPDGTYTAQVIIRDGGGRGANTQVRIFDHTRDIELLIGKLMLPEEQIYSGQWKEYETMTVSWLDDDTLVINDVTYDM